MGEREEDEREPGVLSLVSLQCWLLNMEGGNLWVLVRDYSEAGAKKSYPFEVTEYSL